MITMHARPRQTDRQTERQTNEHHGNSATIRSMNASRAKNPSRSGQRDVPRDRLSITWPIVAVVRSSQAWHKRSSLDD